MTLPRAFFLSVLVGAGGMYSLVALSAGPRHAPPTPTARAAVFEAPLLTRGVSVSGQITVDDIKRIAASGYRTIVDFRPDDEAPDQATAASLEAAARAAGLRFVYIPTPKSTTPQGSVDRLTTELIGSGGPILLYCRVGSRASRIWALAEAGRSNGAGAAEIAAGVRNAGHRIDDLLPDIEALIATRKRS